MTPMKMPKTTEADKALFRSLLPNAPGVTERPMFGQLAGFVNGNMFLCLFGNRIAVKLPDDQAAELLRVKGAAPFEPMAGRPMKGYVFIPESWHKNTTKAEEWVARSLEYASSLPAKAKTAKKAGKPSRRG